MQRQKNKKRKRNKYSSDRFGGLFFCETYPSGATLAYGYDCEGNVNAITQSTVEGEANTNTTLYTAGEVTRLTSGNNTVDYAYDGKRRLKNVKLNGANHVSYAYTDANAETETEDSVTATYANGYALTATYDGFGRLVKTTEGTGENETALTEIDYADDGRVLHKRDIANNTVHSYEYDLRKCLASYTYTETPAEEYGTVYNVTEAINCDDDGSFLSRHAVSAYDADVSYSYTYKDKRPDTVSASIIDTAEAFHVTAKYDALGRSAGKTATLGNVTTEESISYLKHGDHATSLPQSVRYAYGSGATAIWQDKLEYTYDSMSNISEIRENGKLTARYAYDSLNRLIREDNRAMNKTEVLRYDACGNILSRRKWSFTLKPMDELALLPEEDEILYFYSGDKLMSYHGESFAYDAVGNPTTYRGKTLVWEKGRQLKKFHTTSFTYDSFGRRTSKSGSHYDYDVNGNILFDWNGLVFVYDHTGVVGMKYIGNFQTYLFRKDAQGNIIGILDTNGNLVVKYVYDAWGNHKVLDVDGNEITDSYHIGRINPYRYRGYYFDEQTGLYYLQSRYYDPETGRFINADTVEYLDPESINGLNLYAYCGNNPVMYSDPSGHAWYEFWKWDWGTILDIGITIFAFISSFASASTPIQGFFQAIINVSSINNRVNSFYYNFLSDGTSELTSNSYRFDGYINRWKRLDYAKKMTGDEKYKVNAWRYHSEYSFHMYVWMLLGWADGKSIPVISTLAGSAKDAWVEKDRWENATDNSMYWLRNILYAIFGFFGI